MNKNMKIKAFFTNAVTLGIEWIFAVFAPWMFYTCRISHVYIDVVVFNGFCQLLLWIAIFAAALESILLFMKLRIEKYKDVNFVGKLFYACAIATFCSTAFYTTVWIVMLTVMTGESVHVAGEELISTLPVAAGIVLTGAAVLYLPALKQAKIRKSVGAALIVVIILTVVGTMYPLSVYKFVSDPMVLDTGEGYSVVFATSSKGTGYVEYTYDGKDYRIYDENDGRKVNSRIHSVFVPYEHLDGNSYKVGSVRVIDELSYGGMSGKTLESDSYDFVRNDSESQSWLCVSDWHTYVKQATSTSALGGDYDGVILLGDALPGLQYENEAADYIVKLGGNLSKGIMPVIYTRGNHETRGAYAARLSERLGLDGFYGELHIGDYRVIVLDSAEDKADSHPEYGGMVDYTSFRTKMIEYLESLPVTGEKTVVLCHDPKVCFEEDLSKRAFAAFEKLEVTLMISGHLHKTDRYDTAGTEIFLDGGHGNNGDFIASMIIFSPSGIGLKAWNRDGKTMIEDSLEWKNAE